MIIATMKTSTPVVYLTHLDSKEVWVSGTFDGFVTPGRTHESDSVIVIPTDRRALDADHHRGAVLAQNVYAVSEPFVLGELDRVAALKVLLQNPEHTHREAHIQQILNVINVIADHYLVAL